MKKFILLSILILAGCTANINLENEVTASFGLSLYDTGRFPTKGIASEISSALPESVNLTLTNTQTNAAYNVATGEEITLPVGTYSVAGTYNPTLVQGIVGTTRFTSTTPKIVVSDEITIVPGTTQYSVSATYGSFAIGVIPSEVSAWTGRFKGNIANVEYIDGGDVWWTFVTGNLDPTNYFFTTITPTAGSAQSFSFHTSGEMDGGVLAEYGKWYIMHPAGVSAQSGNFSLNISAWESGDL